MFAPKSSSMRITSIDTNLKTNTNIDNESEKKAVHLNGHLNTSDRTRSITKKSATYDGKLSIIKRYQIRDSLLTELFANNTHVSSIHNIIFALIIFLTVTSICDLVNDSKKFSAEFRIFSTNIVDVGNFFIIEALLHLVVLGLHFPLVFLCNLLQYQRLVTRFISIKDQPQPDQRTVMRYWNEILNQNRYIFGFLYTIISAFGILGLSLFLTFHLDCKISCSFAIMMEMCRLLMKAHSFYIEKRELHLEMKTLMKLSEKPDDSWQNFLALPSRPRLSRLVYFLFAPTLYYQDSYPRTEKIRWPLLLTLSIQFFAMIAFALIAISRYLVTNFSRVGLERYEIKNLFHQLNHLFVFGLLMYLMCFYGLFHIWHNIVGELLRFGDRKFYDDWWSSTTLKEYYRKWNLIVQDWIFLYLYCPAYSTFANKVTAANFVVFVSAIFHELIITVSLRTFFPALFIFFATGSYISYIMASRFPKNAIQNILFMLNTIIGWGLLTTLYSLEWYSRINCPAPSSSWIYFVIPRFITCIKM
ncbi:Sterol O-acyltransferase 1 [Sarcoptes scabiei]|uniref:O-acyltransferase n=1 Tax=Sarcoptes scabiei TaxID=52283 RepID=A0A834RB83_SARSC|nr:Sterol O-acyltransferase 1 [Sarcoptes scabiei]